MGQSKSKQEKKGKFQWQKLPAPDNETIHYDPRYEDIKFQNDCILISDYHNRVFEWEGKMDTNTGEPLGYEIKSFKKYVYENKSGTQAGKRFDKNATSLAWIRKTDLFYYDLNTQKVHQFDVSEWLSSKYGENFTSHIPPKAIINLGNGNVLFMVSYYEGTNKNESNINIGTDIVQVDVINKKEVKTVNIQNNLLKTAKYNCVYWGFQLNPNGKEISVLIQNAKKNITFACFVSLADGSIIWQCQFEFIHDLSFSDCGKFLCIFERPRKTQYGYVHVLNLTRIEWVCQVQLTYGTSPLGWDGITWMDDSLVFMSPFDLKIASPGDLQWRNVEAVKQQEKEQKELEERLKKLEEEEEEEEENKNNNDNNNDDNNEKKENVITPKKFDEILQQQKSKEICVLSVGKRWWDLETEVMNEMYKAVGDEHISHLILEYSGLSWAMIKFPYPKFGDNKNKNENDDAFLLQGAMSEVFQSGSCSNFSVLLLAKISRDPNMKGGPFNHWIFEACLVPKTFKDMWNNKDIKQGVIGQISQIGVTENLKSLDEY